MDIKDVMSHRLGKQLATIGGSFLPPTLEHKLEAVQTLKTLAAVKKIKMCITQKKVIT